MEQSVFIVISITYIQLNNCLDRLLPNILWSFIIEMNYWN